MIRKLIRNLGSNAIRVVGLRVTFKMWLATLFNIFKIIREKNLHPIDRYMADGSIYTLHYRFGNVKVDPRTVDKIVPEYSCCFSAVRELYFKDCYLKFHDIREDEIKTVVDLGANRGMASLIFVPIAQRIIAVEADPKYNEAIHFTNTELNGFSQIEISNYFIGKENKVLESGGKMARFSTLIQEYGIKQIDFLKIDIEGSEFDMFDDIPFQVTRYISMEVHPQFGSAKDLVQKLTDHNFKVIMATNNLDITTDYQLADYIFAKNTTI